MYSIICSIGQGGVRRGGIGREGKRGLVTIFDFPNKGNLRKKALIFLSRLAKVHYNPSKFLRSDDGDGNKNVKKGIGSIRETNKQTKSASVAHSFCTFLWRHCKAATWYLNLDMVLTNSSPETFPYIWQSTWVGTKRLWRLKEREFTF